MHKTITGFTVKSADKGEVEAVFSTFNVIDKDGDVTLPGAIKDGAEVVVSAYGHQSHYGALPVGKGVIRTTETEAKAELKFFLNTTAGRETFEVVKELGPLGEWSYSLHDVISKAGEINGQRVNFLESIFVKEVSPVLIGAGVNTRTLVAKGLKFSEEGDAVVAAVKAYLGRAQEVMVLRSEKGRSLSDESIEFLKELDQSLTQLRALFDTKADEAAEVTPEDIKALEAIAADVRRRDLFSNLTQIGA
ncbi:hypothetical protein L2K70_04760 [Nocardioides KLBMP 9356]|uniref:HK97 family phage prohead protease n=1 Tax=Nocardioides potassii TaxID=2911371 RepID=A0ABS9H9L2_9ACTN|nr:hypothetical protein [Nocardioides potassii]MCF6376906.1 hypothetical protein [Nocardioides potassii]